MNEATAGAVNGSNGTHADAPPPASSPPPPVSNAREARRAASRSAFLAAVGESASESPETPPPSAPEAPPADPPAAAPVDDEDADNDAPPIEEKEPDKEPPAAAKPDQDTQKRLDMVQKAEKKSKASIDEYRQKAEADLSRKAQEFERRMAEYAPKIEAIDKAAARVHLDPIGFLEACGFDVAKNGAYLSRQAFGRSEEGAKDPRYRAEAERAMRDREMGQSSDAALKEIREFKEQYARERQAAELERNVAAYMDSVASSIGDETPIVRKMLERKPERTIERLAEVTAALLDELDGEKPDPIDVVRRLEKIRRAELDEELGIDVDEVVLAKPKTKTLPADETKTAPTLSSDLGTPTKPRPPRQSREERRRATIAELERGGRAR